VARDSLGARAMTRRRMPRSPIDLLVFALACGSAGRDGPGDGRDDRFGAGSGKADGGLSDEEVDGVLAVVNALSVSELDGDVGLDHRAANGIVARRDEEGEFEDLDQLDEVPYVGDNALDHLVDYARNGGWIEGEAGEAACLMISEYAEGSGNYNKAIEVWNCGDESVSLGQHSLCLVRNGDHDCTVTDDFDDVKLRAGGTWVVCRTTGGTFNDPLQSLRDRCDQEMPGVVNMSGDDRFAVLDGDGTVLDAFGRLASRPSTQLWADVVLRRCDLEPYPGTGSFDADDHYTSHSRNTHSGLGVAPTEGCE
jgi:hypothetical protein